MGMDEEPGILQVGSRLLAEPPDHFHPAILILAIDERLSTQVVVQMDLVPGLIEPGEAFGNGRHPGGLGILLEEDLRAPGVVIEEQEAA